MDPLPGYIMTKNYEVRLICPYGDSDSWLTLQDPPETLEQVLNNHWDFECPLHGPQREIPIEAREILLDKPSKRNQKTMRSHPSS